MGTLAIIIIIPLAIIYVWYAALIKRRNKALEALSGIDVHYNMRFDLIPNVLKIAQKFMTHESQLLTEITQLRTQAQTHYDRNNPEALSKHLEVVDVLSDKLSKLMVNVENYPDLKSDQTMIQAMQTYNEVEARIAAARRFYNAAVTELNNSVQIFPGSMIAPLAGVNTMPFLEVSEEIKKSINADDYLK